MKHINSKRKLSRTKSHRELMIINQIRSVFSYGYIVTTTPKAKVLKQKLGEFLHRISKKEDLETIRYMNTVLGKDKLVNIAKKYAKESEGKINILRVGFRDGDLGETSKLTLVGYDKIFVKDEKKDVKGKKVKKKDDKKVEEKKSEEVFKKDKDDEKASKGFIDKVSTDLKGKFTKQERSRSRSGL